MGFTLCHACALDTLRYIRVSAGAQGASLASTDLIPPYPGDGERWTTQLLWRTAAAAHLAYRRELDLLVPDARHRVRHGNVRNHIWSTKVRGLCFLEVVKEQLAIPSPEVLLAQMAEILPMADLVALGHELCGSYSLQPTGAGGSAIIGIPPATTTEQVGQLLKDAKRLRGSRALAAALPYIQDGSLSPVETLLSTMAQIPTDQFGYAIGRTVLNREVRPDASTERLVTAESRIPDILFVGTSVGINYDGDVHLDIAGVIEAARELGNASSNEAHEALKAAVNAVRRGAAGDKQRDRDLAVMGLTVLPVTKYDIEDIEGLDRVMGQVIRLIEMSGDAELDLQRQALLNEGLRSGRAEVLRRLSQG